MATREQLIQEAEAKFAREKLIKEAEAKFASTQAPSTPGPTPEPPQPSAIDDAAGFLGGAFRSAAKGASVGFSEPLVFQPYDAVSGAINSYIQNNEFDKAKTLIDLSLIHI